MKKIMFLLFLLFGGIGITKGKTQIKSAVYWTAPTMTLNQAREISKFDLAIVNLENLSNNKNVLDSLKKWNPKILLIAYSNPMEMFSPMVANRPLQESWSNTIRKKDSAWFLRTNLGNKIIFYPGMRMMNLSSESPKIKGQTYGEFMDSLLLVRVLNDSIWDGYFMDNGGPNISWVYSGKGGIDANNDGRVDNPVLLDQAWSQGIHSFLKKIRKAKGKEFILIANKGVPVFMDILNGRMFENFPNNYLGDKTDAGWWQSIANAHQTGAYTIFQVKIQNLRLAIVSALLMDHPVYIAIGQNNPDWYPLLKTRLGRANQIIISRQFRNGFINLFPTSKMGKIFLKK